MINVRIDTSELRVDRAKQLMEWVRSLGLNPADFGTWMLVKTNKDFEFELHLTKRRRGPDGTGIVLDQASGEIVSEPLIMVLTDEQRRSMPKIGIEAVAR